MPQKKIVDKKPHTDKDILSFLRDEYSDKTAPFNFSVFMLLNKPEKLQKLWDTYKAEILPSFIERFPGKRLSLWYSFDAPRQQDMGTGAIYEGTLPVYRRIIQGNDFPTFCVWRYKGVPVLHSDKDILVENECSFLRRYNLLTIEEEKKLRPEDFEKPESFFAILDERKTIRPY